ncbi:MAG: N-acetyltransferase family protein, partial [Planctomycetota bacterium]|nr:N-acetyltransferase family protein [Planctomycetota bacterium]
SLQGRGKVVGFAKAAPYHGRCAYAYAVEITVYVHPDYHGRGIGKALYGRLLSTLKAQGYHAVIAAIAQPNPISVKLHESSGLWHAGTFRGIGRKFGHWHDVGYWYATLHGEDHEPQAIRPVREVVAEDGSGH